MEINSLAITRLAQLLTKARDALQTMLDQRIDGGPLDGVVGFADIKAAVDYLDQCELHPDAGELERKLIELKYEWQEASDSRALNDLLSDVEQAKNLLPESCGRVATGSDALIAQIRRVIQSLNEMTAFVTSDNQSFNTVDEANRVAMNLAKKDRAFVDGGARDWAKKIRETTGKTCSPATVKKTTFWTKTMEQTGRGRTRGRMPNAVSLTGKMEAVAGRGDKHQVLEDLVAEQEAEAAADNSPCEAKHYKRV